MIKGGKKNMFLFSLLLFVFSNFRRRCAPLSKLQSSPEWLCIIVLSGKHKDAREL